MSNSHDAAQLHTVGGLIELRYSTLSPRHRRVADFVLAHPHEAALATLERLSELAEVSPATVTRFCYSLGLRGYAELKRLLLSHLRDTLQPVDDLITSTEFDSAAPAPWTVSFLEDLHRIRSSFAIGGDDTFARASALLAGARQVFLGGLGGSAFVAGYSAYCLSSLRDGCTTLQDDAGYEATARRLAYAGPDDVGLLFAFARYSRQTLSVAEALKSAGTPILGITDDSESPLRPYCDYTFVVPRRPGFALSGPGAGAMAMVDALLKGVAVSLGKDELRRKSEGLSTLLEAAVMFKPGLGG
jgi:DNA-binding MurR/RpiR family transcriptional regulator